MIVYVKKRDGRLEKFSKDKIANAIFKVFIAKGTKNAKAIAGRLCLKVVKKLEKGHTVPSVEHIQDIVEEILLKAGFVAEARAYIAYREEHKRIRGVKRIFGIENGLKLSLNALAVLKKRYLLKDEKGNVIEKPEQMFRRVARTVAQAEKNKKHYEEEFYYAMKNLEFLPNSPCLMNAGTKLGQMAACFVIDVEDSIESIFSALKETAVIFQSGGGVGISFSKLREKGALVKSTNGSASGPVSFMRAFDISTDIIKQGGRRRGALMGILDFNHPDIREFIAAKSEEGRFENFNLSVAVNEGFMRSVVHNERYALVSPDTRKIKGSEYARDIFDLMCMNAWKTGEPGLIFIDEVNRKSNLKKLGRIEATNPCSEAPLHAYSSCVLGSINLAKMVRNKHIDWVKLARTVRLGARFLDDVIEVNKYPLKKIEKMTKANRQIGLGVMGFADMLVQLGIRYGDEECLETVHKLMGFIKKHAEEESELMAGEKGIFPNFKRSSLKRRRRNATLLSIAPTGTISLIAGCSSGIEPYFGLVYTREIMEGTKLLEVNDYLEKMLKEEGRYNENIVRRIARGNSLKGINIGGQFKKMFVTAFDLGAEEHLKVQAAFQRYVDNAVSKTINLPNSAGVSIVKQLFLKAWKLKCKGITLYRYGSRKKQVLRFGDVTHVSGEYSGGCVKRECVF
ncbi:adenosylcobalamin-dependent ribonucleoside-diphosphate reductase [archaeon]|nr:adenosylcobalamin-dependent ribonucleoside-diphosphate reductase [archaeon]